MEVIKQLQAGADLAVSLDRPPERGGVPIEFFGHPFEASLAAAELARASGCALIGVTIVRRPDGYAVKVLPEFTYDRKALGNREARRELTQQILRAFEPEIRKDIDQWYQFTPIWPKDRRRACLKNDFPLKRNQRCQRQVATPVLRYAAWLWILPCVLARWRVAHAADYDAQFNQWFEVQTNLQSWSADFTQTRTLKVLNQPLVSTGKVWVTPGEFRWELGQPVQTIVLRQPDQLLIIYPRLKRAEKYPLDAVPTGPMKDALALLDASLPRDRATMEKNFQPAVGGGNQFDSANDAPAPERFRPQIHQRNCDRLSHQRFHHRRHRNEICRRLQSAERFHQRGLEPAD